MRLTDSFDRARGPMLAAAIGDALGWPIENRSGRVGGVMRVEPRLELVSWTRREGGRFAPHEVEIEAGSYSDDTQLTLAVGRSRLRGAEWWTHWTNCELPLWLVYERGGGGASKRAAQAWNRGHPPWSDEIKPTDRDRYFEAGGNGVAMRIMPHVLVGADREFNEIAADIVADGVCTHAHPRALVGALAQGYALWLALKKEGALGFGELLERTLEDEPLWGAMPSLPSQLDDWSVRQEALRPSYPEIWEQTRGEMQELLELGRNSLRQGSLAVDRKTLDRMGAFDKKTNGAGTIAAAASIFLASRYASQPGLGLTAAAFAKGADTDTIAAMAGALLGAIDRGDWLSGLTAELQDARYIEDLASKLTRDGLKSRPPAKPWRQADRKSLFEALSSAKAEDVVKLPALGTCTVVRHQEIRTKSSSTVLEWALATEEGQTLLATRVVQSKGSGDSPPSSAPAKVPFWLVRQTADLAAAERFYSGGLGLTVTRNGNRSRLFVSDRIVLEEVETPDSKLPETLASEKALLAHSEAITLFRSKPELEELHKRLLTAEMPVSKMFERDGRLVFRCVDPDGHVIEVRAGVEPARQ